MWANQHAIASASSRNFHERPFLYSKGCAIAPRGPADHNPDAITPEELVRRTQKRLENGRTFARPAALFR
jgi:hypothetical protein